MSQRPPKSRYSNQCRDILCFHLDNLPLDKFSFFPAHF
jgi:hypothetical protein